MGNSGQQTAGPWPKQGARLATLRRPVLRLANPATIAMLLLALACLIGTAEAKQERISCLLIGSVIPGVCPLPNYFTEDPLFTYVSDPQQSGLPEEERLRLDRLYFPRTRKVLVDKFDMVFIYDPRLQHWEPRFFSDLNYAFREAGMPSLWSFGPSYPFIASTVFYETLPIYDYSGYFHSPWHIEIRDDREPVFLPFRELGMQRVVGYGYGRMLPRQGSTTWVDIQPQDLPWMVSWRPGGKEAGLSWVCADEFCIYWWALAPSVRGQNPFAIDMMTNLVLHSLDLPLITDVRARREARYLLSSLRAEESLVLSMIEWADKFGANTMPLSERVAELNLDMAKAKEHYLDQEYDSAITILDSTSSEMAAMTKDAVDLKNAALRWVFVSEWLVVTATFCLSGASVWSLMVRRKVYRPAAATRVSPTYKGKGIWSEEKQM